MSGGLYGGGMIFFIHQSLKQHCLLFYCLCMKIILWKCKLCGFNFLDEVGAVVFDVGSSSTRVGFAGEDTPKVRYSFCGLNSTTVDSLIRNL